MKTNIFSLLATLVFLSVVGCTQDEEAIELFVDPDSPISKSDMIALHSYIYNVGSTEYELNLDFNEDFSGTGEQMIYKNIDELSSYSQYSFVWRIKGDKVLLNGISASSSGYTNTSWSAELEYKHGVLVPGKGFSSGYAEYVFKMLMKDDLDEYFNSNLELDVDNNVLTFSFTSGLKNTWPEKNIKYGIYIIDDGIDFFMPESSNDKSCSYEVSPGITGTNALYYRSLTSLINKQKTTQLSESEKSLMASTKTSIKAYMDSFKKGNKFYPIVKIGDERFIMEKRCKYSTKHSNLVNY